MSEKMWSEVINAFLYTGKQQKAVIIRYAKTEKNNIALIPVKINIKAVNHYLLFRQL